MMQDANCDQKFWVEAVNTAMYLKNRSPHKATKGTALKKYGQAEKLI